MERYRPWCLMLHYKTSVSKRVLISCVFTITNRQFPISIFFYISFSCCDTELVGAEQGRGAHSLPPQPLVMALLRAPCGSMPTITAPPTNVSSIACSSFNVQVSVPVLRKRLLISAMSPTLTSLSLPGDGEAKFGLFSTVNSSFSLKGKQVANGNFLVSASSEAFVTTDVKSSEQEEFAKEWAHKPRRVVLFVEPSPFSYVYSCALYINLHGRTDSCTA